MTIREFARKELRLLQNHGPGVALSSALGEAYGKGLLRPYLWHRQQWEQAQLPAQRDRLDDLRQRDEWTLLVFDAGRYDYMAPLLSSTFTGEVQPTFSAARDTFEWITKAWQGDYSDVTYVSGMVPVTDERADIADADFRRLYDGIDPGDSIGEIVPAWRTHWNGSVATVTPETLTDVALDYADRDKLVVHYNQPHSPYIGTPELLGFRNGVDARPNDGRPNDEPIWQRVRAGEVSDEYLRMAYWGNAVRAIEASAPLIRERDVVVATADHGEALGEWGMYTHDRAPHPKRRVVPWQRVDGLAERGGAGARTETLEDKLAALGYR